jgi:hypothetical protein
MKFDHTEHGMNCHEVVRALLTAYAANLPLSRTDAAWIAWYRAHHCRHCGGCDTIETLPPEQDGLCIYCWQNAHDPILARQTETKKPRVISTA